MFSVPQTEQPGNVSIGHWCFAFSVLFHWSWTIGKAPSFAFVLMKSNKHQGTRSGAWSYRFDLYLKKKEKKRNVSLGKASVWLRASRSVSKAEQWLGVKEIWSDPTLFPHFGRRSGMQQHTVWAPCWHCFLKQKLSKPKAWTVVPCALHSQISRSRSLVMVQDFPFWHWIKPQDGTYVAF